MLDVLNRTVEVRARLLMNDDQVHAGVRELFEIALRLRDHQMSLSGRPVARRIASAIGTLKLMLGTNTPSITSM